MKRHDIFLFIFYLFLPLRLNLSGGHMRFLLHTTVFLQDESTSNHFQMWYLSFSTVTGRNDLCSMFYVDRKFLHFLEHRLDRRKCSRLL